MNFERFLAALLISLAALAGCTKPAGDETPIPDLSEPRQAQPKLPAIKLWLGPEEIHAEMAVSPDQIRTGMMFRTNVAETDSMIFVLPYAQRASFWMKNCPAPLSVAYIDSDGVIQEIHDLQPFNTNSVFSASENIRFALETPQGWFQRHNIRAGMTVRSERGPLMETFGQKP
jgi:uncharacterized membrane protein (UPF0127 family)